VRAELRRARARLSGIAAGAERLSRGGQAVLNAVGEPGVREAQLDARDELVVDDERELDRRPEARREALAEPRLRRVVERRRGRDLDRRAPFEQRRELAGRETVISERTLSGSISTLGFANAAR
jgi:hypothetical protein